jgi:Ran GTPase-activating protein (RanGAP) involved in mRNA processing and transport
MRAADSVAAALQPFQFVAPILPSALLGPRLLTLSLGPISMEEDESFERNAPAHLVGKLASQTQLTALSLTGTAPAVAPQLCGALARLTALQRLRLSKMQLTDGCAPRLAAAVGAMTALRSLDVSDNRLSDKGVTILATGLRGLSRLETLMLQHNFFKAAGAMAVFTAVRGLPRLQRVGLSEGHRADPAVALFQQLPRLAELSL